MPVAKKPSYDELEQRVQELERKKEMLEANLNRYELAINASEEGIWDFDPRTSDAHVSSRWLNMLGYEEGELQASYDTWLELLHPDDRPGAENAIKDFLEHPTNLLSIEFRMRTKKGDWRWVHSKGKVYEKDARGNVSRIVGTHVDITERHRLEIDLRTTRFCFEKASIGIYRIAPNGNILDVNRQAALNLGYTVEEMRGMTLFDIDPNVSEREYVEIWKILREKGMNHFERVHRRKDGTETAVEITTNLLEYDGQQFSIAFVVDINNRKKVVEEKEKLQRQLLQAQKMEAVGLLASGIAHDFNNMLSVVLGNAELATLDLETGQNIRHHLERIQNTALRSSGLVRQLLAFARKQTIQPIVLDINYTIANMLNVLRRLIGENIDLKWLPGHEPGKVMLDPSQVDQILANLMVNAKDAINGAGNVTIETSRVEIDTAYCETHYWFKPGSYVMLSVSDSGHGMDKDTQNKIFEPFFTTKEIGRGTGLGLATVYGIVKQNKGFIHVYSEIGQGTIFKIYFPITDVASKKIKSEILTEAPLKGCETVLIVEDDEGILELSETILGRLGYTVITAKTPDQAIKEAQAYTKKIDLLLSDVVMPSMNGRELAQRLEEIIPGIKCLYMSGYTANVIAHHGVLDQGINFLPKPFTAKDLARKVRDALGD
nr:PAS domain S-box protein [uncultured Desulfobacter sp.]